MEAEPYLPNTKMPPLAPPAVPGAPETWIKLLQTSEGMDPFLNRPHLTANQGC